MATPAVKKRRSEEVTKKKKDTPMVTNKPQGVTMTALWPSSYIAHKHTFLRVILEGSARLTTEDKVAVFMALIGTLLSNGKMVD